MNDVLDRTTVVVPGRRRLMRHRARTRAHRRLPGTCGCRSTGGVRRRLEDDAVARPATSDSGSPTPPPADPVTGIQPYLGAAGHVVIMRNDGTRFAHAHAETTDDRGRPTFATPGQHFRPRAGLAHPLRRPRAPTGSGASSGSPTAHVITTPFTVHAPPTTRTLRPPTGRRDHQPPTTENETMRTRSGTAQLEHPQTHLPPRPAAGSEPAHRPGGDGRGRRPACQDLRPRRSSEALDGASVAIHAVTFTAIMGPSGSGQVHADARPGRARRASTPAGAARRHRAHPLAERHGPCSAGSGSGSCSRRSTCCRRYRRGEHRAAADAGRAPSRPRLAGLPRRRLGLARAAQPPAAPSSPAASSSASRSPGRCSPGRRSSSPTSRPATWTPATARRCWGSCAPP